MIIDDSGYKDAIKEPIENMRAILGGIGQKVDPPICEICGKKIDKSWTDPSRLVIHAPDAVELFGFYHNKCLRKSLRKLIEVVAPMWEVSEELGKPDLEVCGELK
jgi:hypothetical protein